MKKVIRYINRSIFLKTLLFPLIKIYRIRSSQSFSNFDKLFSNVYGGSISVSLNNISGIFEIDVRSHILKEILVKKEYEPKIVNLIKQRTPKNLDAINIGANIGLYANLLAYQIDAERKVLAVEPTPGAFKYLETNISINNNHDKVITYKGIASDIPGMAKLNVIEGKEEYSSVGEISHFAVERENYSPIEIEAETVDNLVARFNLEPGILVIDVEGFEFQVLSGAIETLRKYKPVIISELDDSLLRNLNSSSSQVIQMLEVYGYQVTNVDGTKVSLPFLGGNILAYPSSLVC